MNSSTTQRAPKNIRALNNDARVNIEVTTVGLPQTLTMLRLLVDAIKNGSIRDWMIDGASCVYSESGDFVDDDNPSADHSTVAELSLLESALEDLNALDSGLSDRVESENETMCFDLFTVDRSSASSLAATLVLFMDAYVQINPMAAFVD